ncbi:hypothetical protein GALMADRAFT_1322166 [Galerina marginata CBS 339.88]|uniref:Cora-domain-containing protein n=1 Tax=Galerina marginata (strain CBS 339.88) TaxID=685588 RepID=A0A067TP77_GALM3|nr:hypothetical protein GALMADRAFT_1322166 [Galerina marginata CBS 339.88]
MSIHTDRHIDDNNEDIYRGNPPPQDPLDVAPSISSRSLSSSSSSSFSFVAARRIGAIAAKLEHAISRWAKNVRGNSSNASDTSSSSSSTSSTSGSSIMTLTKFQLARRRRRMNRSVSSFRTLQSERDIVARITRIKALEKSRQIPREFGLYLPLSMMPAVPQPQDAQIGSDGVDASRRTTWTASLPLVLAQLDLAMRKPARHHRARPRHKGADLEDVDQSSGTRSPFFTRPHRGSSSVQRSHSASPAGARRAKKGKHRAMPESIVIPKAQQTFEEFQPKPEAWFLDVANPTWADLKAIGKLLHIHPLTLEDILQQDPREKLELFSKLGYYFISFRAIESQGIREKLRREVGLMDASGNRLPVDDGFIGEANVYMAIFKDGMCCFHFTDISEHTNRVRNRLIMLDKVVNKSSDWITHSLLDSIVDSFFPFLEEIEKEVLAIDHIVYTGPSDLFTPSGPPVELVRAITSEFFSKQEDSSTSQQIVIAQPSEKYSPAEQLRNSFRPHFASPRLNIRLLYRRTKRQISIAWHFLWAKSEPPPSSIQLTLRRMARTRKLVTVLGRLLASKSDVITQVRKRLMGTSGGRQSGEEIELSIYMGDVQDHILTLQHSLTHYERMLSQSHPTYLAQLRSMTETAKGGADMKLLYLTVLTVSVLCLQTLTGLFSMNITIPMNVHQPGGPHNVFGIVLALAALIIFAYISLVRHWWRNAKRRRRRAEHL